MISVEEKLRRLEPFVEKGKLDGLWNMYLVSDSLKEKKEIEGMIDLLFHQKAGVGFVEEIILAPPKQKEARGEIRLGKVKYCRKELYDFGIRKEELIKHVGIFGQTGSGKTTACMNLLRQLIKAKIPFMLFDWKRNYRDLLAHPDFRDEEILIFTVGRPVSPFYFNPKNGPRDVETPVWQKKLMEIIEKAYLLGPGAADVLMDAMEFPTFQEMKKYVDKQRRRGREMLWQMSSRRTLNSICFPGLSEVVNCEQPTPIEELLGKNVILELYGLSDTDKAFIIGSLLLWTYYYRLGQPEREILKHVTVVEEAHHLLLKTGKKEDITDIIMREIREFGECMIILDQHPHKISVSALGNCFTKIGFSTSLSQDIAALANSMLLHFEQRKYFGMLKLGEAIVKIARNPFPFLVSVPNFEVNKGSVSDEMVAERMKSLSGYNLYFEGFPRPKQPFQSPRERESLSPPEAILLEDISLNTLLGVDARYRRLGLNPREGNALQGNLIEKGLIRAAWVDRHKLFELTPEGIRVLEKNGLTQGKGLARGGAVHNYFLDKIKKMFLDNGDFPFVEKENIDLVVETSHTRIGIQIETGKSDMEKNIDELSRLDADHRLMVATNAKAKEKIEKILAKKSGHKDIKALLAKTLLTDPLTFTLTEKDSERS